VYFGTEKVIVKGIENDTQILVQTLPGAFDGMIVKINKNQ
jgi:membrane fusion protein (multidrug efflux system)